MKNQASSHSDHEEIFSLLPWFVNQTLEEHQRAAVKSHMEDCETCQREIEFLTSLNEMALPDAKSTYNRHADIEKDLASVMNRIDANSQPATPVTSGASLFKQKLLEWFSFSTVLPASQWGATALAGILVAVVGFQLFNSQPDDSYSVLSSTDNNNATMRLSVELAAAVNQEHILSRIQYELEKIGQQANIETDTDGMFIVVFNDTVDVTELSQMVVDLEREAQIKRVAIMP